MSAQRVFLLVAGLSFVPLLFSTDGLHADVTAAEPPPPVSIPPAGGRISGEPAALPSATGTPPEPPPLAPLPPPVVDSDSAHTVADPSTGAILDSAAAAAVAAAAGAAPAPMPAAAPPDVINDGRPITGSVFDKEDDIDRHPVNSAQSITGSSFDREDRADKHPVP